MATFKAREILKSSSLLQSSQRSLFRQDHDVLPEQAENMEQAKNENASTRIFHSFSNIPVFPSVSRVIQPKLTINIPGDQYEQEADQMAEKVMRMQESTSLLSPNDSPPDDTIQRKCANCEAEEQEKDEPLMRKAENGGGFQASPSLVSQLNMTKGSGFPLPEGTRTSMQKVFNTDFSRVRVHTDRRAADMSAGIRAKAFTHGRDIYFNHGQYAPESREGKHLLAHELTHVVQQTQIKQIQRSINHTVTAQQTVFRLSQIYGVPESEILAANGLTTTNIRIGQILVIPRVNNFNYTVGSGDTLFNLSGRFGVTIEAITIVNNLQSQSIQIGQILNIPRTGPIQHTVVSGDTLSSLSSRYGISTNAIQQANGLSGTQINLGQILTIPSPAATQTQPPAATQTQPPAATRTQPPAATQTPSFNGHQTGQDYNTGEVLERAFLRNADLQTIQLHNGDQMFFERGAQVTRITTNGLWIQVQGQAFTDTTNPVAVQRSGTRLQSTGWVRREWTNMTIGRFNTLNIDDESHFTTTTGAITHIGRDTHMPTPTAVVMHQTGGSNAQTTISEYQNRARRGGTIGSHYVIGRGGDIFQTGGIDRVIDHIGQPRNPQNFPLRSQRNRGDVALGIEHSGAPYQFTNRATYPTVRRGHRDFAAQMRGFTAQMQVVRTELNAISLSPALMARLSSMTDQNLYTILRDSQWNIYPDITGSQKRSSHLLTRELRTRYGLGVGDIYAHEHLKEKTLGEGENILEFHQVMEQYPTKVTQFSALSHGIATLAPLVQNEQAILNAIQVDATHSENAAIRRSDPASQQREQLRLAFYNNFYARISQLDSMITFLQQQPQGALNQTELTRRIRSWRFLP